MTVTEELFSRQMVSPKGTLVRALLGYAGELQNRFRVILTSSTRLLTALVTEIKERNLQRAVVIHTVENKVHKGGGTNMKVSLQLGGWSD